MKNNDWTKWYTKTNEKIKEENEQYEDLFEGMTDRQKQTAEIINKRYREIEEAVASAESDLKTLSEKADYKTKKAMIDSDVAKSLSEENSIAKGDNRALSSELNSKEVEKALCKKNTDIENEQNVAEDKIVENLDERVATKNQNLVEEVRKKEESYNTTENNIYDNVKKEIDQVLAKNKSTYGGIYNDVKDELLQIIELSKDELGDKADELIKYVESKNYYTSAEQDKSIIYVNDQQYEFTDKEMEMLDSIRFDALGRYGLVYGDGLKLEYNGKKYKATAGDMATDLEKSIVTAICARKKITPKVGTCIFYQNKVYVYAGDNYWRKVKEIGKVNAEDGLYALVSDYRSDLENENTSDQGN